MSTEIFSNICNGPLRTFLLLSAKIGQDVINQAELIDLAFQAELRYLEYSENFKKPASDQVILEPITNQINKIIHYLCIDPILSDHINVIAHSIRALLWIQEKDPVSFFEEVLTDLKSYTDVLLVFFKDKEHHVEWVDAWIETLNDLNNFVRRRYPKGLTWRGHREDLDHKEVASKSDNLFDHTELFNQIERGNNIHKVLCKVNNEHTEAEKHLQGTTDLKETSFNEGIFLQDGKTWRIEHKRRCLHHLTIDTADNDNVVNIFDCSYVTIIIEKKINVIKLDTCENVCVIFRSLISGIDIINCKNLKLHAFGTLPSVSIVRCNDVNIHLTKRGIDAQVVTSLCSKVSLSFPMEDGYYKTFQIPNRLMTTIDRNQTLKSVLMIDE